MLGILTLETAFPRIKGDVGCAETFPFRVRHLAVAGATVEDVVHRRAATLCPASSKPAGAWPVKAAQATPPPVDSCCAGRPR